MLASSSSCCERRCQGKSQVTHDLAQARGLLAHHSARSSTSVEMNQATSELRRLNREIRNTAQRLRRRQGVAVIENVHISSAQQQVAVCLYQLQGGDISLARAYLQQKMGRASVHGTEALQKAIVAWRDAAASNRSADILPPTEGSSTRALARARAFEREATLVGWVRQQNEDKGLAPSTQNTLAHDLLLRSTEVEGYAAAHGQMSSRGRRKWIRRWAKRWQVTRGTFKPGLRLPLEERRAKVSNNSKVVPIKKPRCVASEHRKGLPIFRAQK